ncbi:hypothetical protein [Pseudaminobacter sp. NGMCC 1.201702]|uniref:hypothetical protein n=1 Tax=Pseudaminobacter sp. NGMCC 1.201702 TaxID=3391825 RepID=UPI0039EE9C1F
MSYFAAEGRVSQAAIEGGIEISEEQYQAALAGMLAGKLVSVDGGFAVIDPPQPEPEPEPEPLTLDEVKVALKSWIDASAEQERLKYITPGAGQAMTYQRKVEEARAASTEQNPDPADYPLLSASVGIDGPDLAAVAAVVLAMDAAWTQIGAAIEAVRLGTKKAIDDAAGEAAARAAVEAAVWPV